MNVADGEEHGPLIVREDVGHAQLISKDVNRTLDSGDGNYPFGDRERFYEKISKEEENGDSDDG
jgi:hypothetical protein